MSPALKNLEKKVLSLPLPERMALIGVIYESVDSESVKTSKKWIKEVDARIESYESGDISSISVDESMKRLWSKLEK